MKGTKKVLQVTQELADTIVSTGFAVLRPVEDCDPAYLAAYLSTDYFERQKEKYCSGAIQPAITNGGIEKLKIPLPPVNDQIRIATLLGKVEGLIAQRKQHLKQLDDLLKSVFLEMFGDPVQNKKCWESKTAIDYADCIVPGRDKPKSFSGKTPWVTTGDLQQLGYTAKSRDGIGLSDDEIKEVCARVVPKSSVLLTCVGDLGVVSICTTDMVVNQQLHAFQVSETMSEEFFMYSLSFQKKYMYQNASQTTLPYMNKTICNKIPMIRPPKDLQIKFTEIVRIVHGIKARHLKSLTDLESLYGALSQQAFRGELDLSRVPMPGIQPEEEKTVAAEPLNTHAEQGVAINLPDTDNLLDALESAEAREVLILQWLKAYRDQLGSTPFSVQHFMAVAQTRLTELHLDNDFELGANDYEHIKTWVFEALAAGTLTQTFDEASNCIQLKAVQA
jgi:type I restriction enzyme S subunit